MIRNRRLQNRITTGRFTLPVAILLSVACWVLTSALLPDVPPEKAGYPLWEAFKSNYIPIWAERLLSFILYCIIGYMLIELNNVFTIIRMRASVQTSIYFLLIAACPALYQLYDGDVASVMFLLGLFFLFKSYQEPRPTATIFHSFAFIGAGSLLLPQLTFFIPVFLIGAYNFQSLTPKSFFAALVGWSFPYWLLLGHSYFYGDMDLFYQPFIELVTFQPINFIEQFPLWKIATLGYMFVVFVVSAAHCLVAGYEDKIRTRTYLHFLILLSFCIFAYMLLQPMLIIHLLPVLLIGLSILAGHLFVLTSSRSSNVFFLFSLIGLIALFCFNVWTLL